MPPAKQASAAQQAQQAQQVQEQQPAKTEEQHKAEHAQDAKAHLESIRESIPEQHRADFDNFIKLMEATGKIPSDLSWLQDPEQVKQLSLQFSGWLQQGKPTANIPELVTPAIMPASFTRAVRNGQDVCWIERHDGSRDGVSYKDIHGTQINAEGQEEEAEYIEERRPMYTQPFVAQDAKAAIAQAMAMQTDRYPFRCYFSPEVGWSVPCSPENAVLPLDALQEMVRRRERLD